MAVIALAVKLDSPGPAIFRQERVTKYGKIFRIGGDEFAAMLHVGEEELERLQRELETAVSEWTGEKVRSLSVSTGYVSAREFPSEDLAEIGRISDERMYAAKTEYYRRSGIERRKT